MGLEEAGGRAGLVGWSAGWGRWWGGVFCRTGSQGNDGQACLLMPRDTVFSEEQQERGRAWRRKEDRKKEGRVCWPHVTVCALPCLPVAGCHAERRSQGLKAKPVQMRGGVTAVDESLGNCPLQPAPGAMRRP